MNSLRCLLLFCISIFATTAETIFHVVAPNTWRLDTDETIAIAIEGSDSALVDVKIQDYPGKIKVLSQAVLEVRPGHPEVFKMHLNPADFPSNFLATPNSEKLVSLSVSSNKFNKEVQIPISGQAGYVFVQTDKPLYTPTEMVHLRIITLTEEGLPSDNAFKLQIKNPKGVIVKEKIFDRNQDKFQNGFVRHKYTFPNYPIFGEWAITVSYGYEFKQNTTVHFELQKYVLPTFTVELITPDIILESDKGIPISVKAKYVYGKKVKGMVTLRLGVKGEAPTVTFFAIIKPKDLNQGSYRHILNIEDISHQKDIGWFPEIEGSHLVVEATVIDSATGNKEVVTDAKSRFSKSPFLISFARCLKDFRPGLVSSFEADIKYADGKPAAGIPTRIKASSNSGELNATHTTTVSNEEGRVSFEVHPEIRHQVIHVTLETNDPRYEGNQAVGSFEQHRFKSADQKSFIALERSSIHKPKIGDKFVKLLHLEPAAMKDIYYAVISRGKIIIMNKLQEGEFKTQKVNFKITHEMVPNFRIVAWTQYDNQLLADSLNIDVEQSCAPDAQVSITPEFNIKEPGVAGKIIMRGTKGTRVGLLGVDEAVYALSKRDLLTKAKIFGTFAKHDLGCGPGGGLTTDDVLGNAGIMVMTNIYSPPADSSSSCVAIKRQKRAVASDKLRSYSGLEKECCALGMNQDIHGRTCEMRTNIVTRYLKGEHQNCSRAFLECCLHAKENGFKDMKLARFGISLGRMGDKIEDAPEFISAEDESFLENGLKVRQDFREMWFFEDFYIKSDNKEEFGVSLPHSITTWVIQAVAVSSRTGICIAEPQKVVSFKKVFLQLNLPYSVVRNEQVEIQAAVFNYGEKTLNVIVYMYGVKDLCSGANEGEKSERKRLVIEKESAGTVTFPVIPLKEGTFDIKVVALSPDGGDIIMRKLNVIAEGYPTEIDIPLTLDPSNQQNRKKRHVSTVKDGYSYSDSIDPSQNLQVTAITLPVPEDFVPGTESCTITALGDQFGPIIETSLNDPDQLLQKPQGCGEQNMMFLAPTLYTMRYLKVKGKISPEIEEKGYNFIRHGYGNQMSFRKEDGSYAAYLHTPTSIWLTAFVIKVFCQANELIHIDENVMCSGIRFLINNQQEDGSFIEHRPVYHADMMGGVNGQTPLTAFTLITLEECECSNIQELHVAKKRALAYLEEHLGEVQEPLAVAIMAYALSLSDSVLRTAASDKLHALAQHDEEINTIHWATGDSAHDVEATAYALLNHVFNNDMDKANSIVNWLNSQKLQSGAFKSTQDTVIALQALSEYAIRAQMPTMNLVANMSSSNDRNFYEIMSFNERNAHVLQGIKMNKIGGTLFVHTAGHGVGSLAVKLRYNKLHPPPEKLCKFDVTVNVSEEKNERKALNAPIQPGRHDVFDRFPPDLIRGAEEALNAEPENPVIDIDPRNRAVRASLVPHELFKSSLSRRVKRRDGLENSKLVLKISICARHLGGKPAGMSIVDVGIFSGFEANEEDLKKLQDDQEHLIDRYEKSNRGIVFYLQKVPSNEHYCFQFHITREFLVGKTHSSIIKVYDYYNPDDVCTTFYSPGTNSPMLQTLCDGGICQCAEGGCPPRNPFDVVKTLDPRGKREKLKEIACDNYDFVWKGKVNNKIEKQSGFYNISFEIEEVIKEGIEKTEHIENDVRFFLARDNCETAVLTSGETYLVMGKDGQKYKNENDEIWHRYLLDKKSAIYLWTSLKTAKDKELQRALNQVVKTLKNVGCDQ